MNIQRSTERSTGRSTGRSHGPRAPISWRWRPQPGCLQDQGYLEQLHACERILGTSMARNRQRYAGKHTTLAPERHRKRSHTHTRTHTHTHTRTHAHTHTRTHAHTHTHTPAYHFAFRLLPSETRDPCAAPAACTMRTWPDCTGAIAMQHGWTSAA